MARKFTWSKRAFYFCVRLVVNPFFMLFYGVRFYGRNNMPETGPVLVVANHQSHFDPPLIGAGLRRNLNYLARKSLFKSKFFAWLIDALDAIPLDIEGIGFDGIKECLKRLRGGEMILIFPEGARTWDGKIAPFKEGALTMAQKTKATILPVGIAGCYEAWPRTKNLPRLWGRIRVVYGEAIPYEIFKNFNEEELRHFIEQKIEELFLLAVDRRSSLNKIV